MKDILLTEDGDLQIENGDFVIGESSLQHQHDIILAHQGEFKEHPEVGVGIADALLDERPRQVLERIKRQLQYDGMTVNDLAFSRDGKLEVNAQYPN